jgi:hypothetical protein
MAALRLVRLHQKRSLAERGLYHEVLSMMLPIMARRSEAKPR